MTMQRVDYGLRNEQTELQWRLRKQTVTLASIATLPPLQRQL